MIHNLMADQWRGFKARHMQQAKKRQTFVSASRHFPNDCLAECMRSATLFATICLFFRDTHLMLQLHGGKWQRARS
jgi:hypothetical protein